MGSVLPGSAVGSCPSLLGHVASWRWRWRWLAGALLRGSGGLTQVGKEAASLSETAARVNTGSRGGATVTRPPERCGGSRGAEPGGTPPASPVGPLAPGV